MLLVIFLLLLSVFTATPSPSLPPPGELLELLTAPGFLGGKEYGRLPLHVNWDNAEREALLTRIWGLRQIEAWLASQKHFINVGVDVDVSKGGERLVKNEHLPASWSSLWQGFAGGGTLILNDVNRHPAWYDLGTSLNLALGGIVTSSNTYVSPPASRSSRRGAPGFNWHYDDSDVLVVHHSGAKMWSVCDPQFPLHRSPVVRDAEAVLGADRHCRNLTLAAGQCLYLPFGSYHKAWPAPGDVASVHTTISLKPLRHWHAIFEKVLLELVPARCRPPAGPSGEDRFGDFLDEGYHLVEPEASRVPEALEPYAVRMAVDNDDLPEGVLGAFATDMASRLTRLVDHAERWAEMIGEGPLEGCGAGTSLGTVVRRRLKNKARWRKFVAKILDQLRVDYVGMTPRYPAALPLLRGSGGPLGLDTVLRRSPTAPVALSRVQAGQPIVAVQNTGEGLERRSVAPLHWALGWNDPATRRGRPFAIRDIPTRGDDDEHRLAIGELLIGLGVMEIVDDEGQNTNAEDPAAETAILPSRDGDREL